MFYELAKNFSFLCSVLLILAPRAFGGWSSSGGGVSNDEANPWFIASEMPNVLYCVDVDEKDMGLDMDLLLFAIDKAIKFWQAEFAFAYAEQQDLAYRVTTSFTITKSIKCHVENELSRLRFQFGKLTDKQKEKFPDYRDYVSAAIRTDYNRETLTGEGYIYVAPQTGPLRPNKVDMHATPWALNNGDLLTKVLIHEMSHVFGFSHKGNVPRREGLHATEILSVDYPDYIVGEAAEFESTQPQPTVFRFLERYALNFINATEAQFKFFGIPVKDRQRNIIVYTDSEPLGEFEVRTSDDIATTADANVKGKLVGRVTSWIDLERKYHDFGVSLWLPPEQKVFAAPTREFLRRLAGPALFDLHYVGGYRADDTQQILQFTLGHNGWIQDLSVAIPNALTH